MKRLLPDCGRAITDALQRTACFDLARLLIESRDPNAVWNAVDLPEWVYATHEELVARDHAVLAGQAHVTDYRWQLTR